MEKTIADHKWDLKYIKEHFDIDPKVTSKKKAQDILEAEEINTTSWVLDALAEEYGETWAEAYRQRIRKSTCDHGFLGDCHYCKYGTD